MTNCSDFVKRKASSIIPVIQYIGYHSSKGNHSQVHNTIITNTNILPLGQLMMYGCCMVESDQPKTITTQEVHALFVTQSPPNTHAILLTLVSVDQQET